MFETMWRTVLVFMAGTSVAFGQAARLNQVVDAAVSNGQFMGSVLVARDNEVLLNKGYGSANLEWGIPNTPSTTFRLGSVTKQFTAAAILLLEDRGELKIDDPVRKYIPDAPEAWKDITIFHCLTHTSGLYNFTRLPEYRSIEPLPITSEKLIATFRDRPLDFPPGTQLEYSNSGYAVLGMVVEKVSGQAYATFIQDNICQYP
jgi:CubicO group peptidase (beta-lactamase class C family)